VWHQVKTEQMCGQKFRVEVEVSESLKKAKKSKKHPPRLTSTRIRNMRLAEQSLSK